MAYRDRKFDEIVRTRISDTRNAVISRTERKVETRDGKKVMKKEYLIAQQIEVQEEDGHVNRAFIKGGSVKLSNINYVKALRDALNMVLKEEGMYQDQKTCKCSEKDEPKFKGEVHVSQKDRPAKPKDEKREKPAKKKVRPEEARPVDKADKYEGKRLPYRKPEVIEEADVDPADENGYTNVFEEEEQQTYEDDGTYDEDPDYDEEQDGEGWENYQDADEEAEAEEEDYDDDEEDEEEEDYPDGDYDEEN